MGRLTKASVISNREIHLKLVSLPHGPQSTAQDEQFSEIKSSQNPSPHIAKWSEIR